jgi:hypothetical protein
MAMLVTDTCWEKLFVFPGLRIMAVYRKFKRYFANDHCCWCTSFPRRWNSCRDPMICPACKSKSLMIWTTLAPKVWVLKPFWHKRSRCKSYQRQPSAAAGSGSAADAGGSQLQGMVRLGMSPPLDTRPHGLLTRVHSTTPSSAPAPAYWITSVAWNRSVGGIVRPRAWAVLRLMTSSNFIGCSMGRSPGLAPFRMRST